MISPDDMRKIAESTALTDEQLNAAAVDRRTRTGKRIDALTFELEALREDCARLRTLLKTKQTRSVKQAAHRYNLSEAQVLEMRRRGICEICGKTGISGRGSAIDHDHKTGKVRGLLCASCNAMLAGVERPEFLRAAVEYLRRHGSASPSVAV